jgi:DNA invertase Pin-like site-specific DNA recombinase
MAGKTIGYARTSPTSGQDIALQVDALKEAGCIGVFSDVGATGDTLNRSGLQHLLRVLKSGDTLKVASLDRIARSVAAFAEFRKSLGERKIRIVLLKGDIETTPVLAETAMRLTAS